MEALQEAIAETLYDYEVAEKIWSNKANRYCADCWAHSPDWASINLCVVICKQCAGRCFSPGVGRVWVPPGCGQGHGLLTCLLFTGQHRSLGSNISKVQSLKLDTSVWSNEIVQVEVLRASVGSTAVP